MNRPPLVLAVRQRMIDTWQKNNVSMTTKCKNQYSTWIQNIIKNWINKETVNALCGCHVKPWAATVGIDPYSTPCGRWSSLSDNSGGAHLLPEPAGDLAVYTVYNKRDLSLEVNLLLESECVALYMLNPRVRIKWIWVTVFKTLRWFDNVQLCSFIRLDAILKISFLLIHPA
jgi:hypothetical protein